MYEITASTGESLMNVTVSFATPNVNYARSYYHLLRKAFCSVNLINDETSEVLMSIYTASEFFCPQATLSDTLSELERLRIDFEGFQEKGE